PLDARVEQHRVVEVGDLAVVPEVDGGDGRKDEALELEGLVCTGSRVRAGQRVHQALGLAEAGGKHYCAGLQLRLAGANLPSALRRTRDCIYARVQAHVDTQPARQLYHRLEELAHRLGRNA